MLNLILGRSGSGKSEKLRKIMKSKIESGKSKIILIVPEQSSFENEKEMLEFLGNVDFNKIHVLSFSRLYDFVSQVLNVPALKTPPEIIQIVQMNAALESIQPKLNLYKKSSANSEIANVMLDNLKKLRVNKIDASSLEKIEHLTDNNILKQKISEIRLIEQAYENMYEGAFASSYDALSELENILKSHNVFKGYDIFFDEFSNFTAQQLAILEIIFSQAQNIYMAFCCDKDYENTDAKNLFSGVCKVILKIKEIAKKCDLEIGETLFCEINADKKPQDLKLLEENVFRTKKSVVSYAPENIQIYSALNQNEECEYLAQTIKKFVIEQGYKYKDFAVLTRDASNYSAVLKSVFKKYDIPYFLSIHEKIFNKSIVNFIFASLDLINSNFLANDIFRFLKSGLIDLSVEEIALLENYVLLWDIKGQAWFEEFKYHPEGMEKQFSEENLAHLNEINVLREKVILPLKTFCESIKKTTGKGISKAIYELIVAFHADVNLQKLCQSLKINNQHLCAQQEAIAWDFAMQILDEMAKTFEKTKMSVSKYANILFSVVKSVNFSSVPQSMDNVVVGDVSKGHITHAKVVFLIGAVEGEFPKIPEPLEIFTDSEINHISSLGIEFSDNSEFFLIHEKFLAYMALSSVQEKLFVSFPNADLTGKSKFASEIIKEVKTIFPKVRVLNYYNFNSQDMIFSKKAAFEILSKNLNSGLAFINELYKYFEKNEKYAGKLQALEKIVSKNNFKFDDSSAAKNLFTDNLKLSPSQIEKYFTCRFEYFCMYILKAKAPKPARFGALEYGNIVHFLFEKLFHKYPKNKIIETPFDLLTNDVHYIIDGYIAEKLNYTQEKNERLEYKIRRLKSSLVFLLKYFIKEFKQSLFDVKNLELSVSSGGDIAPLVIDLPDGTTVSVEGKIDRVDIMPGESGNYLRIIDYKTGFKDFKLSDILYGLNMQMLIYWIALKENAEKKYGKIIPAGVLYFTALKPIVDMLNKNGACDISNELLKKMRMNGLVLDDINAILGMEQEGKGAFIPAEIKNGEIKNSQAVISRQELEIIEKHIKDLIQKMAQCLKNGEVSPTPVCKEHTACKFCDYFSICGYEDEEFVNVPANMANKKAIEQMANGGEKNNG